MNGTHKIRFQIGYPLSTLPNVDGFMFRGVEEENADLTDCIVICDADGIHRVYRISDRSLHYHNLRGWMQHLPQRKPQ